MCLSVCQFVIFWTNISILVLHLYTYLLLGFISQFAGSSTQRRRGVGKLLYLSVCHVLFRASESLTQFSPLLDKEVETIPSVCLSRFVLGFRVIDSIFSTFGQKDKECRLSDGQVLLVSFLADFIIHFWEGYLYFLILCSKVACKVALSG